MATLVDKYALMHKCNASKYSCAFGPGSGSVQDFGLVQVRVFSRCKYGHKWYKSEKK